MTFQNPMLSDLSLRRKFLMITALLSTFTSSHAVLAQQDDTAALLARIHWTDGPARVSVGSVAQMDLPAGYRFTDGDGARLLWELNQNPSIGNEAGAIMPDAAFGGDPKSNWVLYLHYDEGGHVQDEEKDSIDDATANAILDTLRRGNDESNQQRASRGWPALTIEGWSSCPFYDPQTHHLTWSILVSSNGVQFVNYNSRILGRDGVISANLVIAPDALDGNLPAYRMLTQDIAFVQGKTYEEFRPGDKIAKYGLVGLITGGAAVVVVKAWTGLVKIGAVIVGLVAAALAKFRNLFRRRSPQPAMAGGGAVSGNPPGTEKSASSEVEVIKCPICGQSNRVRVSGAPDRQVVGHPVCGRCKAKLRV